MRGANSSGRPSQAKGGNNDLSLEELAEQARNLPSRSWRVGVAIITAGLIAALVALALEFQDLIGLI